MNVHRSGQSVSVNLPRKQVDDVGGSAPANAVAGGPRLLTASVLLALVCLALSGCATNYDLLNLTVPASVQVEQFGPDANVCV